MVIAIIGDSRTCVSIHNYDATRNGPSRKTSLGVNCSSNKSVLMNILKSFERPCIPKQRSPFIIYDEFSDYQPQEVRSRHDKQVKPSKALLALLKRSRGS